MQQYFSYIALSFVGALVGAYLAVSALGGSGGKIATGEDFRVENLEASVAALTEELTLLKKMYTKLRDTEPEVVQREIIREKSQDQQLQDAVAMVSPAVVSVVATKDVPLLEVSYENPFGDDPYFKDFGFRVPVYRQRGTEEQQVGAGTGFLVTPNGYILTNRHVVSDSDARYSVLLTDGTERAAEILYRDQALDLAVLKIAGENYSSVSLGDSGTVRLGQSVFAIGNALGQYSNSVSTGIISGLNRTIRARDSNRVVQLSGVLQTDAAINPGNSGGPLVALSGEVIGVNVATVVGSENISFSIPIDEAKEVLERYIGSGR